MSVITDAIGRVDHWPTFTDEQVSFLEKMFPARCIGRRESAEDHLRHAGKVELIAEMRSRVVGTMRLDLDEDEEAALDEEAIALAEAQQNNEE